MGQAPTCDAPCRRVTCAPAQPHPSGELRAAAGARHCRASDAAQRCDGYRAKLRTQFSSV
ncbi:hypothetical protein [Rubritalea tangerina]|uniref:hypothetical protein n=1 Tax=Rubritalea tangerina TaxID=430798 RepID=UPI003607F4B1